MRTFGVETIGDVSDVITIAELTIDGVGAWKDFFQRYASGMTRKDVMRIQSTLEQVGKLQQLPYPKWHPLKNPKGEIREYEAKAGDLRLYAIKYSPGFIVILGGIKGNQDKDIARMQNIKTAYLNSLK